MIEALKKIVTEETDEIRRQYKAQKARVAILPFDKFDVKNGLSVISPDGKQRQVNPD